MSTPTPTPQTGTIIDNISNFIGNSTNQVQLLIIGGLIVILFIAILMLRKRRK